MDEHHFAGIHAAITALSVDVGRLSERLIALDGKLTHHTKSEHEEFKEALQIVADIKKDVASIQSVLDGHKGAWWILAKLGLVLIGLITLATAVVQWLRN